MEVKRKSAKRLHLQDLIFSVFAIMLSLLLTAAIMVFSGYNPMEAAINVCRAGMCIFE